MDEMNREIDAVGQNVVQTSSVPLPPEAPLVMAAQDLRQFNKVTNGPATGDPATRMTRALLFALWLMLTVALGYQMWLVLSVGETNWIEKLMLVLFIINISWIALGTSSVLLGLLPQTNTAPIPVGTTLARTALLLPIYNEDPARVIGTACATLRALEGAGAGASFDLFLLSDTNQLPVWLTEQALVDAARDDDLLRDRLFYRHRLKNRARKSGNIEDWVTRWGGAYEAFVVLDADSLMETATLIELSRRMAADPTAGIIQTAPRLISGQTPLARAQQFASRVYAPALVNGLCRWFGDAGNYWGHNAIIRTEVFAGSAGLPILSGDPPFGGAILSHDFVEAALVRRAGYAVRMADDLAGSYEAAPPNLIELTARDRRWCQGNLQHLRVVGAAGLHPLSRLHLAMGVLSYLSSPLWLLYLLTGMVLALYARFVPPNYFPDTWSLFPTWPQIDSERAISLFAICMAVLLLPKLIGLLAFLRGPYSRGMRWGAFAGFVVENILSALIAPVMMLTQTRSILEIITGRDSGWNAQTRDADRIPFGTLWRFHRMHTLIGITGAVLAWSISWSLFWWMSPALIGLILSVPVAALVGSQSFGLLLQDFGLLTTPEERQVPDCVSVAEEQATALMPSRPDANTLDDLIQNPILLARHIAWLDTATARHRGEADLVLASAMLKLNDSMPIAALDTKECYAIAASPLGLDQVTLMRPQGSVANLQAGRTWPTSGHGCAAGTKN